MATELQSKILRLAAEASLAHPTKGWPEVCSLTGLREEIMKAAGCETGSFTGCLEAVGLTRVTVVDAFVLARPSMQRTLRYMEREGYVPVIPAAPAEQEKAVAPALKPVPCRTESSLSKPALSEASLSERSSSEASPQGRPANVESPDASRPPEAREAIMQTSKAPPKDSAKPARKAAKMPISVQGSLF